MGGAVAAGRVRFDRYRHFEIDELVDRETFAMYGEGAWMFFNREALMALDDLWEFFGGRPITVNNYKWGGNNQFRGYRPRSCRIGGDRSQHNGGNAFDCDVKGIPAAQARQKILENSDHPLLRRITCLEAEVNWLHFDCRNIPDRIRIIRP